MNRRLAFVFIIITLTIDAMCIGLIIPVMPDFPQEIEACVINLVSNRYLCATSGKLCVLRQHPPR